jgi:D-sedoheptulose 7-phosphate isomerase
MVTVKTDQDQVILADERFDMDDYLSRLAETLARVRREEISAVIEVLFDAWKHGKRIYVFGNGGSAATASHIVNDLCKLTIVEGCPRVKAIGLNDNVPLMTAWSNDTNYENIFSEQLRNLVEPGDVILAISTSGHSPSILRALEVGREHHATCMGLTGDTGGKLKDLVDYCIFVPDSHMGRQEDAHMILDHIIANALKQKIHEEGQKK